MLANLSSALQRIVVFAPNPSDTFNADFAELQHIFPSADFTVIDPNQTAWLLSHSDTTSLNWGEAVNQLRRNQFEAAIILTAPGYSPYTLGYLCYLAAIPIRIGSSYEFGGQVLSHCLKPQEPFLQQIAHQT
ncbi:hypothetical protein PN498_10930 [Oscillatoria sp. CS-180]|uniref:hypothetical protein n=1 Tax=Oscillatoria sp. CS-180 TaxID=3021720 RepID=UPI00232D7A32|nr:hypothetical protein [Oscillatoria sp. CS-180]MDB9526504.1 hypothetical protein [Oscillatoria sp. CS-180]